MANCSNASAVRGRWSRETRISQLTAMQVVNERRWLRYEAAQVHPAHPCSRPASFTCKKCPSLSFGIRSIPPSRKPGMAPFAGFPIKKLSPAFVRHQIRTPVPTFQDKAARPLHRMLRHIGKILFNMNQHSPPNMKHRTTGSCPLRPSARSLGAAGRRQSS